MYITIRFNMQQLMLLGGFFLNGGLFSGTFLSLERMTNILTPLQLT